MAGIRFTERRSMKRVGVYYRKNDDLELERLIAQGEKLEMIFQGMLDKKVNAPIISNKGQESF